MRPTKQTNHWPFSAILLTCALSGCSHLHGKKVTTVIADPPRPLGAQLNDIHNIQMDNAEASKYVVHEHEFALTSGEESQVDDAWRLNEAGEDHVKRIAVNLKRGDIFPVVVERSQISPKSGTEYQYPIHRNEQLDLKRRAIIVSALQSMGVEDAEQRVVIAPAFAEGLTGVEASSAYARGMSTNGRRGGGGGLGGSGGGGFGGLGGGRGF